MREHLLGGVGPPSDKELIFIGEEELVLCGTAEDDHGMSEQRRLEDMALVFFCSLFYEPYWVMKEG